MSNITIGTRVSSGTGEDADTGVVIDIIDHHTVMVAWDSHVTTPASVAMLTVEGDAE